MGGQERHDDSHVHAAVIVFGAYSVLYNYLSMQCQSLSAPQTVCVLQSCVDYREAQCLLTRLYQRDGHGVVAAPTPPIDGGVNAKPYVRLLAPLRRTAMVDPSQHSISTTLILVARHCIPRIDSSFPQRISTSTPPRTYAEVLPTPSSARHPSIGRHVSSQHHPFTQTDMHGR